MTGLEKIKQVIPHRDKMLMIDEMREYTDQSGVGIHHVRSDEFWCSGHFPGKPIMPGVLQIEALAQTACFIVLENMRKNGDNTRKLGYFTTMEKIRFSRMVRPGDTLELHVELTGSKLRLYKFQGIAMVGGAKVCEATFSAIMNDYDA
jgi:3-hydroxyacyl-[acyl-carrier-protein] dehydratase